MAQYRKVGNTRILPNGDLRITANNEARAILVEAYRRHGYSEAESAMAELLHELYDFVRPESIGALTEAPILCASDDMGYSEEAYEAHGGFVPLPDAAVFWFPDYALRDPWEELKNHGFVVFARAPE
jgi:hypothetical protein